MAVCQDLEGEGGSSRSSVAGRLRALLTAIISYFDRQLLRNNMSFTLCSIHILFNSNKFHKFWMSSDFKRIHDKSG